MGKFSENLNLSIAESVKGCVAEIEFIRQNALLSMSYDKAVKLDGFKEFFRDRASYVSRCESIKNQLMIRAIANDITLGEMYAQFYNNKIVASHYMKEVNRMSLPEKVSQDIMVSDINDINREYDLDVTFKSHNNIETSNCFIARKDCKVKFDSKERNKGNDSKMCDGVITVGYNNFFVSNKYTQVSGGSQDNAFNEMRDLAYMFKHNDEDNWNLILVLDGAYWNDKTFDIPASKGFVCTTDTFKEKLVEYCKANGMF